MPCYDSRTSDNAKYYEERTHELTRMLCWICGRIEMGDGMDFLSPEIQTWWEDHKKADQEREGEQP